ncbi:MULTISPECIES: NYN domain-containing protein [unclassified Nocardioides]|uniref:NYN domain-containing protein n=1 Tax=unclassified Nocardioides TaxID=2615069 RepID=UPI00361C53B5
MDAASRITYVLVDGENIDATLGTSILGRRPRPEERPRWERLLQFARERWAQPATGLFFLAANNELPMAFVQALLAIGYRPVALSGSVGEKVVDIAIQRTLDEIGNRDADVLLVSNDGDFVDQVGSLLDGRRVGVVGFVEFRNQAFIELVEQGLATFDLEYDVRAFNEQLPRVRIIPIDEFDPTQSSSSADGPHRGSSMRRRAAP